MKQTFEDGKFKLGYDWTGISRESRPDPGRCDLRPRHPGGVPCAVGSVRELHRPDHHSVVCRPLCWVHWCSSAAGQVLNIYAQVGLVMLIGLAGGNAILIVDNQQMGKGMGAIDAARFAAKSRLRPILMTSISSLTGFLLDAGQRCWNTSQASLGLVVFGGLLVATFLSTLVVPVFFVVMKSLLGQADAKPPEGGEGGSSDVQPSPQPS